MSRATKSLWNTDGGVEASEIKIGWRLTAFILRGQIAARKLLARYRQQHIEFAQAHLDCSVDEWRQMFLLDYTSVHLIQSRQRRYVRQSSSTRIDPRHIMPTVHASSDRLMVWV